MGGEDSELAETILDYRGMGPFLPYAAIEKALREVGSLRLRVDPEVADVLATWAKRRGYVVEVVEDTVVISLAPEIAEAAPVREVAEAAAEESLAVETQAPPMPQVSIKVSEEWRKDISERLADIVFVIEAVLRAPILYRGPISTNEFASAIGGDRVLVRVQLSGQDYFLYIERGAVKAASQIGASLTPKQAETIVEQMLSENPTVTVYDASKLFEHPSSGSPR